MKTNTVILLIAAALVAAFIYWQWKRGNEVVQSIVGTPKLKAGYVLNEGKYYKQGRNIVQCITAPCPPVYELIPVTKEEATL